MATTKPLLVAANLLAGWAVVSFLPPCAGSIDDATFCLPGWRYMPNPAVYAIVVCVLAWATSNIFGHFTDDDEARNRLVLPLLVIGNPIIGMLLVFLLPPCPSSGGMFFCLPEIPYMRRGTGYVILGVVIGRASTRIYESFGDAGDAKLAGYAAILGEPEDSKC